MSNSKTLNWNDRFALLDHFNPDDKAACKAFGVSQTELETARDMKSAGAFTASKNIDANSYSGMFKDTISTAAVNQIKPEKSSTSTRKQSSTSITNKPESATKTKKEPKKRGRKGDKIAKAFANIPAAPVPVEQFASDQGVSLAVLRQSKRFDNSGETGNVRVKKDKNLDTLMIWRESV